MSNILKDIENGTGTLTEDERAALDDYADREGARRVMYQVYDDTGIADDDYLGTEKVGPRHATEQEAIDWARSPERNLECFSVYREKRCVTRKLKIWYAQGRSPAYSSC